MMEISDDVRSVLKRFLKGVAAAGLAAVAVNTGNLELDMKLALLAGIILSLDRYAQNVGWY